MSIRVSAVWCLLMLAISTVSVHADDNWIGLGGAEIRTWPEFSITHSRGPVVPAKAEEPAAETESDEANAAEVPPAPALLGPSIPLEPSAEPLATDDQESKSRRGRNGRSGRFQLFELPRDGNNFGMFGFQFQSLLADPQPTLSTPLMNTGWGITWLDGPSTPDLPGQLYNVNFDLGLSAKFNDRWRTELAVTPAWYTDWKNLRPEAFRLQGRAVSYFHADDQRTWVTGFVFLNRDDIAALPVFGMIWDRQDDGFIAELVFPVPKVSVKVLEGVDSSVWMYVGGELGGGSWAIKRQDRTPDVITYRDLRAVLGVNRRTDKGSQHALEAGWVFDRSLESRTGRGDYTLADTLMVRWLVDY